MSISPRDEERLRKEWKEECIRTRFFTDQRSASLPAWPEADRIFDWMLAKMEGERKRMAEAFHAKLKTCDDPDCPNRKDCDTANHYVGICLRIFDSIINNA